jgi:hypothetical protein
VWRELVARYNAGVDTVRSMRRAWSSLRGAIDDRRLDEVASFLDIQEKEARWWRDAALQYFQQYSRMPIPAEYEQPAHPLSFSHVAVSGGCLAGAGAPEISIFNNQPPHDATKLPPAADDHFTFSL